jgi:hypothetical protein
MKTRRQTSWVTAVVLFSCWLSLADRAAGAGAKAGAQDKIKELQKQRLEAAKKARDYLAGVVQHGYMPKGVYTSTFVFRLVEVNRLVLQARLDLCEGRPERIKAVEETIKEFEPLVEKLQGLHKAGAAGSALYFHLAQAHLLELRIALEKARQATGGR